MNPSRSPGKNSSCWCVQKPKKNWLIICRKHGLSGFAKRWLRRRVCTWGLANRNFIVFVIVLLSFWFVCPRHILLLLLLLLLLVVVLLTILLAMEFLPLAQMVLLSVHICYWCWRRCWCWNWCGATYSHVNDTTSAHKWSWSIRTKRYRFFNSLSLSFYHALRPTKLLTTLHKMSIHIKDYVWTF